MQVRLLNTMTGTRNGEDWPPKGSIITVPDAEAVDLLNAGIAAPVAAVENAAAPKPAESAAMPDAAKRAPGRPRKTEA